MTDDLPGARILAGAGIIAGLAATLAAFLLANLSKPTAFETRLAKVAGDVDRTQRLAQAGGSANSHRPRAVCPGPGADNLEAVRSAFFAAAARAGVSSPAVSLTSLDEGEHAALAPVRVSLQASGGYDAVLGMLGQFERLEPEVFVDVLELKSKTSSVDLKLSGKVYCWPAAH